MRPTLKEIAEAPGYSIATVSRALNGSPRITPETRRSCSPARDGPVTAPPAAASR